MHPLLPLRLRTALSALAIVTVAGCGGDSPAAPSSTPPASTPPTPTLYAITGIVSSAAGGGIPNASVRVNDGPNAGLSATADGSGRYTLSGLTFAGFTVSVEAPTFLTLSRAVPLTAGVATTTANFDLLPAAVWTHSGTGNTVFDMPSYFSRVRIVGVALSRCENFIVHIGRGHVVNEIIGTCSIASGVRYDGIHLTQGGGTVEIVSSSGVAWSFTEQR